MDDQKAEMKKYLVVMSPRVKVPEDGLDVALIRIGLCVRASNAKEARKLAVETMEEHRTYGKVAYVRKMKGAKF